MNEADKQQLSREVAALYKIHPFRIAYIQEYDGFSDCFRLMPVEIWLADDSGTLFDLAMENYLMIVSCVYTNMVKVFFEVKNASVVEIWEKYADHNNDRKAAARIAAMKALKAKKEGER